MIYVDTFPFIIPGCKNASVDAERQEQRKYFNVDGINCFIPVVRELFCKEITRHI